MTNLDRGQKNVFSTAATFWYATIKRKEWVYFQLVTAASPLHCPSYKLWYTKKKKRNYKVCSYKIIVRRENLPAAYYQKLFFLLPIDLHMIFNPQNQTRTCDNAHSNQTHKHGIASSNNLGKILNCPLSIKL